MINLKTGFFEIEDASLLWFIAFISGILLALTTVIVSIGFLFTSMLNILGFTDVDGSLYKYLIVGSCVLFLSLSFNPKSRSEV